ncbi:MAG: ATP-binding cassette domain-containing protein, partial [Novosphingobium sp.]
MIRAENVTVSRAGRKLIDQVSLTLEPGRFSVVIGPNGAGKSTLMKVLSGEMVPDSGHVSYYGADVAACKPVDLARRRAVLPQATQLAFPFSALEIARMGA